MGAQQSRPGIRYRTGYTNRNVTHIAWLLGSVAQFLHTSEYKPPVTLGLIAANTALFYSRTAASLAQLQVPVLSIHKHALQPYMILEGRQWGRLLASAFIHHDEAHLSYNMTSLLWKGAQLETMHGSLRFAALVAELLVVSHALVVGASCVLKEISTDYGYLYYQVGSVGFSAVLFGLKVVLNHRSPGYSSLLGITLPTKYMCWLELVVAQLVNPQASFLGHACGILAGLLHVHCTSGWAAALSARVRQLLRGRWRSPQYFSSSGRSGRAPTQAAASTSSGASRAGATPTGGRASAAPGAEQASTPQRPQGTPHVLGGAQGGGRGQPSQEELRQRRLARFGQS